MEKVKMNVLVCWMFSTKRIECNMRDRCCQADRCFFGVLQFGVHFRTSKQRVPGTGGV